MIELSAYIRAWKEGLAALLIIFLVSGGTELTWAFYVEVYVMRWFMGAGF